MAFATIDLTKGITGTIATSNLPTIPVTKGGTGLTSGTSGQFLKFTGSTAVGSAAVDNATAKNFQTYLTNDVNGKSNNTWYYLGYSAGFGITESIDNGNMWDASNGFFVAPDTGQYQFYIYQACYGTSTHDSYDIGFCKLQKAAAGSSSFSDISGYLGNPRTGNRYPNKGYIQGSFKTVVSLTAGERIIFGVHVYAGGSQTDWEWAKEGTYFGGVYLGD